MIIRSKVLGAGANALGLFPGFTNGKAWEQAWEQAWEHVHVASRKMFELKVVGLKPYWPYVPLVQALISEVPLQASEVISDNVPPEFLSFALNLD